MAVDYQHELHRWKARKILPAVRRLPASSLSEVFHKFLVNSVFWSSSGGPKLTCSPNVIFSVGGRKVQWRTRGYEDAATIVMRLGAQDVASTGLDGGGRQRTGIRM